MDHFLNCGWMAHTANLIYTTYTSDIKEVGRLIFIYKDSNLVINYLQEFNQQQGTTTCLHSCFLGVDPC